MNQVKINGALFSFEDFKAAMDVDIVEEFHGAEALAQSCGTLQDLANSMLDSYQNKHNKRRKFESCRAAIYK
jgi:hypothetical protein